MQNFLTIGGKKRPLYFGMNGIRIFCKTYKIGLQEFADAFGNLDMDKAINMIRIALNEGERRAGGNKEFSVEQVSDFLDENFDVFGEATQKIIESLPFKKDEKDEKEKSGNEAKVAEAKP